MSRLNELITFEYERAYAFAYDLTKKQLFSTPKIYSAKGNLNKRWYVYFSFREPSTGKLKRVTPIYGIANKYKTKEEQLSIFDFQLKTTTDPSVFVISFIRDNLLRMLQNSTLYLLF